MKFDTVKIGEYLYIKGRIGWKGLKKNEYLDTSSYRIINGESLTDDGIDWNKAGFISKERYEESPEIMLQPGDILISKDGTIGKIGYVDELDAPTTVASGIFVVRNLKPQMFNTRFIYHFFTSQYFKNFITMRTEGSVIPHLYQKDFVDLDFPLPELSIQNKIVDILDAISQKIDVNKSVNNNLMQQATALFRSWFIDFEPFGGVQPDDWNLSTLGQVSRMGAGGDKPKTTSPVKTVDCPYPIYSNGLTDYGLYGYTNEPKISEESVTVSARGTIGFVCLRHIPYVPIVRLVTLIPHTPMISAKYLYLYLRQLNISGTGTTQQQLTVPDFRKTEIIVPSEGVMDTFTKMVTPMFEKIWVNEDENTALAKVRAALLPKLLSGEIELTSVDI